MEGISNPALLRKIPMFFIIGMGRSGTTLLKTIFDNHPELICPPESKLILFLRKKYQDKVLSQNDAEQIVKYVSLDRKVQTYWNFDFELLAKNLKECINQGGTYNEVCKLIYLHHPSALLKKNVRMIGDKNPGFTMYIDWLNENFEGSKFIHIIRDYRDCIASYNRVFRKSHVGVLAKTWLCYTEKVEKMKLQFPDQFISIRYEDLTNNPEYEISRICDFLKIEADPAMFIYNDKLLTQSKKFETTDFNKIHGELLKPIHNKNIGKYKNHLSQRQLALIEYICSEKGKNYRYEPTIAQKKNFLFPLISLYALLVFRIEIVIIKCYYRAPYFLRNMFRKSSNFLFSAFRYSNKYNNAELMLRKKPIKNTIG